LLDCHDDFRNSDGDPANGCEPIPCEGDDCPDEDAGADGGTDSDGGS
jgi:hypothetical protein